MFPVFAVLGNFSWESANLLRSIQHILLSEPDFLFRAMTANPIRTVWWLLDIAIVFFTFRYIQKRSHKQIFAISMFISAVLLYAVSFIENGTLFSCFIIDLLMAVDFIIFRKKIHRYLKIPIATTKLLGDTFAWLCYRQGEDRLLVEIIGIIVLVLNISYVIYTIYEKKCIPDKTPVKRHPIKF